jgi:hypothetical protein
VVLDYGRPVLRGSVEGVKEGFLDSKGRVSCCSSNIMC